ncbi:response regulator [Acidaminococcus fermentans]|uniref:response regulator n=1 Tax=Acidaminococcus fermentans TaxID=905 RepID=UPI0024331DD0|nr:response regulator [Acidaminococcus fermentans]
MIRTIIVEDDPMVAALNKQYLLKSSSKLKIVGAFKDGQSALDYLLKKPVDLVILDVYLPVLNGLELLQQIRQEKIETDVIMVTAARNRDEIQLAMRLGVMDYLVKPFDFDRFQQAIQHFFHKHDLMTSKTTLDQGTIDAIAAVEPLDKSQSFPKGLQAQTLKKVLDFIASLENFTCKAVAVGTGLSIVTTQRYLNYLVDQQKLKTTIDYHTGGRPKLVYRLLK